MTQEELEKLVTKLLEELDTLKTSVATLITQVSEDFLQKLQDVKIDTLTFGDVLQYSSDGKWHNVQPSALGVGASESGGGATSLTGLKDVMVSGATNGLVLTYDSSISKWTNKAVQSSSGTVDLSNYLTKTDASNTYLKLSGGSVEYLVVKGETQMLGKATIAGDLLVKGGITMYNS